MVSVKGPVCRRWQIATTQIPLDSPSHSKHVGAGATMATKNAKGPIEKERAAPSVDKANKNTTILIFR